MRSRDELEARVRERTGELSRLNGLLVHEIEERKRAEEALFQAAMTDSLTGLQNRRAMEQHLEAQASRVARGGKPFAVLMCDLDRFKSVNDAFGHEAGDEFLRATGRVLKAAIRAGDMVCRWGGEEFLVLLADTDLEGALAAAGKLRRAMEELRVPVGEFMVTRSISIGVSVCEDCRNLDEVLRLADEALYGAKDLGRNRVSAQGPHDDNFGSA
jgi:diguanylate cyclase (GGDEF)-like protein